jgi:hypothetical protein
MQSEESVPWILDMTCVNIDTNKAQLLTEVLFHYCVQVSYSQHETFNCELK